MGQSDYTEPKDWKDTYSASIGAKYQLNETVALLAGYYMEEILYPTKDLNRLSLMPTHIFFASERL